jgi:hypothetical protein
MVKNTMKVISRCVAMLLALTAAACNQSGTSATPAEPSPASPAAVESFSGTLQPQGTNYHTFTVAQTGYVEVTLIGVVPQLVPGATPPLTIGVGIGTPSGAGTCLLLYQVNAHAGTTAQIVGTATAGPDCLAIFDVGTINQPVNYTVTVAHS